MLAPPPDRGPVAGHRLAVVGRDRVAAGLVIGVPSRNSPVMVSGHLASPKAAWKTLLMIEFSRRPRGLAIAADEVPC
jgi:hypothetical protein